MNQVAELLQQQCYNMLAHVTLYEGRVIRFKDKFICSSATRIGCLIPSVSGFQCHVDFRLTVPTEGPTECRGYTFEASEMWQLV